MTLRQVDRGLLAHKKKPNCHYISRHDRGEKTLEVVKLIALGSKKIILPPIGETGNKELHMPGKCMANNITVQGA
jgi:hypothetical protein